MLSLKIKDELIYIYNEEDIWVLLIIYLNGLIAAHVVFSVFFIFVILLSLYI